MAEEIVDWMCRPVPHAERGKLGGWRSSSFILGAVCLAYIGFGGIFFNLVLYLMRVWADSSGGAANQLTNVMGTMYLTSILGSFVGDAYLGRLSTLLLALAVTLLGSVMLGIASTLKGTAAIADGGVKAVLYVGLYVAAVGNGSLLPLMASLGGDQFESPATKATFFNWFFVFCNLGQLLSVTFLSYLENAGSWALGFWITAGAAMMSLLVFLLGAPKCRQNKPGGNPLLRIVQVLACATRKMFVALPVVSNGGKGLHEVGVPVVSNGGKGLHEVGAGQPSAIPGARKLKHTNGLRLLDKAAVVTPSDGKLDAWHVCTVTQVEEVKCLVRVIPFVVSGVVFHILTAQVNTFFVEQGATMRRQIGGSSQHHHEEHQPAGGGAFEVPSGSMQLFTVLAAVLFTPLYDYVMVPWLRRTTGKERGLTTLQRQGWGLVLCAVAMVTAALVEKMRLRKAAHHDEHVVSIFWLVPQYVVMGVALVFKMVGQMDFFYSELSDGMRSIALALPLVAAGLGNYASTLLVTLVTRITSSSPTAAHHTRPAEATGWIPRDLDLGHLDYFYWLLSILMCLNLAFYLTFAIYSFRHE